MEILYNAFNYIITYVKVSLRSKFNIFNVDEENLYPGFEQEPQLQDEILQN